jgi:hypothetical protein
LAKLIVLRICPVQRGFMPDSLPKSVNRSGVTADFDYFLIFNAGTSGVEFRLPRLLHALSWYPAADTACLAP